MKILFVSQLAGIVGGGSRIAKRNLTVLQKIFLKNNVEEYCISVPNESVLFRVYNRCLKHYTNGLGQSDVDKIVRIANKYDYIWVDGSCFGSLCKILKEKNYTGRIFCFFHNIEHEFLIRPWWQRALYFLYKRPVLEAERTAARYADFVVCLTSRDRQRIKELYGGANTVILPSSLNDDFQAYAAKAVNGGIPNLLFVGSNFFANVRGISWFIEKVLPYVNAKLVIVGSGMDALPYENNDKLEIHGFVDDIAPYYQNADCVIAPIFEGSGMKTKTTEALMWGKYIIGTEEAFCGFDMTEDEGISCQDVESFIKAINDFKNSNRMNFNSNSRNLFLEKYSIESSVRIIRNILKR